MFGLFAKPFGVSVSRIGSDQSEACAALHGASFTFSWPSDELEALLTSPSTYANGAFVKDDDLVGFILSRLAADEAEILTVAVAPKRRGLGIAGKLIRANMEQLQIAGAKTWFLEVEAQNVAALSLYKRSGFDKVGERKSYYRKQDGDPATAYILRRNLR